MRPDEPTGVQSSGSAGESKPRSPSSHQTAHPSRPAHDEDERTPALGTPPQTELEKTVDQTEIERRSAVVRSSLDAERTVIGAEQAVPDAEKVPTVPGYRPIKKLGEGTFGKVWLFEALQSGKRVAVKFFTHGATQQWQLLQAEIMQLARLYGDPGIVQLQDLEPEADPPYCILTYAEGGSIADRLKNGPMPVAEALDVFREAAAALAYVHAKGIIHCDLKPGNVLRDARGRALLADFGQAHLASDLTPSLGTFFYMAPEQADLAVSIPDTRWDVYALGALFFTMVTGRPPGDNPVLREEIGSVPGLASRLKLYRDSVRSAAAPEEHRCLPGMDRRLVRIIDHCLETDPAKRLRDGGAVLEALNRRSRALRQRPVLFFGLLAPVLLLLVTALGVASMGRSALRDAEEALIRRQLEDNTVLAKLAAGMIESKLDYRLGLLERFAHDDRQLRQALTDSVPPAENVCFQERIDAFRRNIDEHQPSAKAQGWLFFEVFAADREGFIVADNPRDDFIHRPLRWAWRGWFNGEGDKHGGDKTGSYPIGSESFVSQPYVYRGEAANQASGPLVIALSVPVRAPDSDKVVGRLVGLMKVTELHQQLDKIGLREKNGCVVLMNERRHLIYHGLHNEMVPTLLSRNGDPRILDEEQYEIRRLGSGLATDEGAGHLIDPIDHKNYFAVSSSLQNRDWRLIVQSEAEETLKPARNLSKWMRYVGFGALILAVLLILGLYSLLQKTLRRGEQAGHA